MNIATKATVPTVATVAMVPTDKSHGPTLEEGMKMIAFLERHGGVDHAEIPEPYRAELKKMRGESA